MSEVVQYGALRSLDRFRAFNFVQKIIQIYILGMTICHLLASPLRRAISARI